MRKLVSIFVIVVLSIVVGCASTKPPYYGDYEGESYIFTLDENGVNVRQKHETRWVIFNSKLLVYRFDEEGNQIGEPTTMGFSETDSTYVLSTKNATYVLRKTDESTMAIQKVDSRE